MAQLDGEVTDVLGQTVNAGDQIAGAFRIGNVAVLRVGTVLGFAERGNKLTVRVQWHHQSNEFKGGREEVDIVGAIEAKLTRFVKINSAIQSGFNVAASPVHSIEAANDGQEAAAEVPVVNP